ncbi:MAG TPA: glycosyltransferase family 2 protein [Actinomycetota bacterium]|nr:glycosyltransferase family 2 protein [Actinomycetota bacterium]
MTDPTSHRGRVATRRRRRTGTVEAVRGERPAAPPGVPSVLAIVVTHDGRPWLRDCLVALNTQTYPVLDVLVVDDASPDFRRPPHLRRIAKRHLRRRRWGYVRTPRPLGFGGAINWALSRVRTDAELLLFVHDDAALDATSVERMVARIAADDGTAIVGPKIVSWDDPARLEEVGMAADRFGYPYKGLEDGEIDLGQHDVPSEVFYVTSTCMLMRHEVFRQLGGWDARMRAFAEDLDICWRAHVAGYSVRVEPGAKAKHAIALATGRRRSPFKPQRYYIRRNRFRTVIKNVSRVRLLFLLPQFVLLAFLEMLAFVVLRQPRQIVNLARALLWNLVAFPQTIAERTRVQRRRRVPDRRLRRLSVRETTRLRFYMSNQAHRLEEAWGRRAEVVARQSVQARALGGRLAGWTGVAAAVLVVVLLLGFRHFLWTPPAATGELLPFPERASALWRVLASPWQPAGLGYPGPSPPAFGLLGLVSFATFGAAGAAQKVLVLGLLAIGFAGAYGMVSELVDRRARVVAGLAYALGGASYASLREGRLGALVFFAAAPFVVTAIVRLVGWVRPPAWRRGRAVATIALGAAVSAAFVPGSLLLYALAAAVLAAARTPFERAVRPVRGMVASFIGLVAGWALLLPWSATWFDDDGVLGRLFGDDRGVYAATFADHGVVSVVLGQTPEGPALWGLALPLLGVVGALVGAGQRRRLALALWGVVVATGWVVALVARGVVPPFVASPTEAGVLATLAFSGLVGVALGAFRLDLPRRGLGLIHALTLGALAAAAFLAAAGIGPAAWRGAWRPHDVAHVRTVDAVEGLLAARAEQLGAFRTLWIGERWVAASPSALRPQRPYLVTGAHGQVLTDLYERPTAADDALARVVASIEDGDTDRGGRLLGAFNVRFVVVASDAAAAPWLSQLDLALTRDEPDYALLEARTGVARADVYDALPPDVAAAGDGALAPAAEVEAPEETSFAQRAAHTYVSEDGVDGPAVAYLAESHDGRWRASAGDDPLPRAGDGAWGNAFDVPADADGRVEIVFPRSRSFVVWLVVMALAWIVVVGAAFSRGRPPATRRRVAS